MIRHTFFVLILGLALIPQASHAQEVLADTHETLKARVVEILDETREVISGTDTEAIVQTLSVEFLSGTRAGERMELRNDFTPLDTGDVLYVSRTVHALDGREFYAVSEPYRIHTLLWLTVLFVFSVCFFGGKQGIRGLVSLIGSLAFIYFMLLPGIASGYSPILVSIVVSSFIIILGSYVTHGWNKTTSSAVIGMIATVIVVGVLAHISIGAAHLTGYGADEAVYLNFNSRGSIDLAGLLLGGILIGLLGVMYDAAIGQSISVEELHRVAPHLSKRTIYTRAVRIGREHIGALVNTLAIAYVGASLPLLLLFYSYANESAMVIMNREIFSTEIVRSLVGSIGLILTVPITTFIAVAMLVRPRQNASSSDIKAEDDVLGHIVHSHHGHHHGA